MFIGVTSGIIGAAAIITGVISAAYVSIAIGVGLVVICAAALIGRTKIHRRQFGPTAFTITSETIRFVEIPIPALGGYRRGAVWPLSETTVVLRPRSRDVSVAFIGPRGRAKRYASAGLADPVEMIVRQFDSYKSGAARFEPDTTT